MFLKNKNIIFKIRRSKVTDYAALTPQNINTTSGLLFLLHGVISLPDATSCDKKKLSADVSRFQHL